VRQFVYSQEFGFFIAPWKCLPYSVWGKKLIEWSCTAAVTTGRFPVGISMVYCKYLGIVLVGWLMAGAVSDDCIWSCARIFFNLPWRTSLSHHTRHVCMMSQTSLRESTYSFGKLAGTFYVYILAYCVLSYWNLLSSYCRSQWPRGLRRRSSAARLLRFWVRIPPRAWKFVCCECCVLSGRGLCDGLITRPEESYRPARHCVWSRNLEHEEAKARYRAVKIQPQWV
jgi:hypothetical protein